LPSSRALALACLLALGSSARSAETPPATIAVTGLPRPGNLGQKDLTALGATTTAWTVHGTKRMVTGVRLDKVLTHLGFSPGPMGKDVPVAEKRAVFSVAECVEGMGRTDVLVVWTVDGKPLGPDEGPFRLAVLTDGEPSRSLRQLKKLEVVDVVAR